MNKNRSRSLEKIPKVKRSKNYKHFPKKCKFVHPQEEKLQEVLIKKYKDNVLDKNRKKRRLINAFHATKKLEIWVSNADIVSITIVSIIACLRNINVAWII